MPAELKQQVAAESSLSQELLLQLEQAQHTGPTAQQLARLRAELAEREEEQLCQRCRCGAGLHSMGGAVAVVLQRRGLLYFDICCLGQPCA